MPVIILIYLGLSSMVGILILMGADAHSEFSQRMIRCNFTSWLMVFILCHLYTLSYNYSIDRPIKTETLREVVGPERNTICENCKVFERITKTNYQWLQIEFYHAPLSSREVCDKHLVQNLLH